MRLGVYPKRLVFSKSRYPATAHNAVEFLQDGDEVYPAMLAAIAGAEARVHLESYIFDGDIVGWRFARALAERARAGVAVRVMVDALGSITLDARLVDYLRLAGVAFKRYNSVFSLRYFRGLGQRNHRKILTVDGAISFVGGLNICVDHVPPPLGKGWHDAAVKMQGPVTAHIDAAFWREFSPLAALLRRRDDGAPRDDDAPDKQITHPAEGSTHEAVATPRAAPPAREPAGRAVCQVLSNQALRERFVIRQQYLRSIRRAARTIVIANAYFLPDFRVRRALVQAARRGVEVKLLLPSESDVPLVKAATEALYERFLGAGIKIREWPWSMLHHKVACFDGEVLAIGSYNLDFRSLRHNLEISVWISGSPAVAAAERALLDDFANAREVTLAMWQARGWWRRLYARVAFWLRRQL